MTKGKEELIVTKDYKGEDRRKCEGCTEERAALQRLTGATTVRDWLLRVMVVFILGGGIYGVQINKATADMVGDLAIRVALTEEAIKELKRLAEDAEEHREKHDEKHDQDKQEIIRAIKEK